MIIVNIKSILDCRNRGSTLGLLVYFCKKINNLEIFHFEEKKRT
jgi:hypothetical protein